MRQFRYLTPATAQQASGLLREHAPQASAIAGGQSLLLAMKDRTARPQVLVSLAGIGELSGIRTSDTGELVVGATPTYAALAKAQRPGWPGVIPRIAGDLPPRPPPPPPPPPPGGAAPPPPRPQIRHAHAGHRHRGDDAGGVP